MHKEKESMAQAAGIIRQPSWDQKGAKQWARRVGLAVLYLRNLQRQLAKWLRGKGRKMHLLLPWEQLCWNQSATFDQGVAIICVSSATAFYPRGLIMAGSAYSFIHSCHKCIWPSISYLWLWEANRIKTAFAVTNFCLEKSISFRTFMAADSLKTLKTISRDNYCFKLWDLRKSIPLIPTLVSSEAIIMLLASFKNPPKGGNIFITI